MLRNYLLVAFRNIKKQKFYAILNILGLGIGIASCLFIILYMADELRYDRFHTKADRIYRVGLVGKIAGQEVQTTNTCPPMAFTFIEEFPEVVNATRLYIYDDEEVVRYEELAINEEKIYYTDSTFFEVFDFKLLEGDPFTLLDEPNTVVLTESMVKKYFGQESALGKTLLMGTDRTPNKVTGIMEDPPSHSHFHFHMLRSMASLEYSRSPVWLDNSFMTYLVLNKEASPAALEAKFPEVVKKYVGPDIQQMLGISVEEMFAQGGNYGYFLQPLTKIHLHSHLSNEIEPNGDILYVYIFAAIAFFIIIIACINFMNLSTARSGNRAKEVGIRKTLGTLRNRLVGQFLTESVLYSLVAALLAVCIVILLMPSFNQLAGKAFSVESLIQPWLIGSLLGLMLLVGMVAGSYPAFYLSSFKPAEVLKGKLKAGMRSGSLRSVLVVFQFTISIGLIICTLLVFQQLKYTQQKNMGFDKENLVVITGLYRLKEGQQEAFRQSLLGHAGVLNASISNSVPPGVNNTTIFRAKGTEEDHIMGTYHVDYDYLPTMQIELAKGRNFSKDFPTDTVALLLNEAAVREFGYEDPLNQEILYFNHDKPVVYKVIGVMKDFNFESLRQQVRPLALMLTRSGSNMSVRVSPGDLSQTIQELETIWNRFASDEPFEYSFLDEDFDALFRSEQRLGNVFSVFTSLAILVACLGLLGLAAFTAEQRTKEIGIRKVMGASVVNVMVLLSKDFTMLVLVAFVIAVPVAYFIMRHWLQGFAYRIDMNMAPFVLAGVLALILAWLTVSWQSFKAARVNPVKSLRNE